MSYERRQQWFKFHDEPIDRMLNEIYDDHRSGFRATLKALRSGTDLETAIVQLQDMQDRRRPGRRTAVVIASQLVEDCPDGLFGASIDTALVNYLAAVQGFQISDAELYKPWYATYIEQFRNLVT